MATKQIQEYSDNDVDEVSTNSIEQKNHFGIFSLIKPTRFDYRFRKISKRSSVKWLNPTYAAHFFPARDLLHSGKWSLEFRIKSMQNFHIAVGFAIPRHYKLEDIYEGYPRRMGAGSSDRWYDPSTGDIVCDTHSIHDNLPKFTKDSGIIGLELDLSLEENGSFTFIVNGVRTPTKSLRPKTIAQPAIFLFKKGQKVVLKNLKRMD